MKSVLALSLIHGGQKDKSATLASTSFLHTTEGSLKKCALSTKVQYYYVLSNTAQCQFHYLNVPICLIVLSGNG